MLSLGRLLKNGRRVHVQAATMPRNASAVDQMAISLRSVSHGVSTFTSRKEGLRRGIESVLVANAELIYDIGDANYGCDPCAKVKSV